MLRNYFIDNPSDCTLTNVNECQSSTNVPISVCPRSSWFQPPLPINVNITGQGIYIYIIYQIYLIYLLYLINLIYLTN